MAYSLDNTANNFDAKYIKHNHQTYLWGGGDNWHI